MMAVERWRSWLSSATATNTITASAPTFAPQTDIASVGRSARLRRRIAMSERRP